MWHQSGFKGPLYFVESQNTFYLIVLSQNSKGDMIKELGFVFLNLQLQVFNPQWKHISNPKIKIISTFGK